MNGAFSCISMQIPWISHEFVRALKVKPYNTILHMLEGTLPAQERASYRHAGEGPGRFLVHFPKLTTYSVHRPRCGAKRPGTTRPASYCMALTCDG